MTTRDDCDAFESASASEEAPKVSRFDAVVDGWLAEFFHGPHHVRALSNPHGYICEAAQALKRRLAQGDRQ